MAKTEDDGDIGAEVSSRLDELFGDDDDSEAPGFNAVPAKSAGAAKPAPQTHAKPNGHASDAEDSPVKNLKALVFGIDWEITDDSMMAFLKEVRGLQQKYSNDKVLSMFLKLHESIGKYIKAKKARAHPDALQFVTSVFTAFEKVLLSPGMPEAQKKKLLSSEVQTFKNFKQQVLSRDKAVEANEPQISASVAAPPRPAAPIETPSASLDNQAALDYIVEELKKTIKAEFHTMRQILKNLGA